MKLGGAIVTLGETMALFQGDRVGDFAHVSQMTLGIGGAESNVAIAASRLGVEARWIGRVGSDGLGNLVVRELRAEGLSVHATVDLEAPTGVMVKERPRPGVSRVRYYRAESAGSRLCPDDLPSGIMDGVSVLHVTGITPAISASAADAVFAAIAQARDAGVVVSFDVNHRSRLWSTETAAPVYEAVASLADIVFAGEDEAALFVCGDEPSELARAIAALGPSTVIIKRGALGALAWVDGTEYAVDPVQVDAVDTVGAGDAFVGAYLAELTQGAPLDVRLRSAARAGAYACTAPGDWEGMPTRAELDGWELADPVDR